MTRTSALALAWALVAVAAVMRRRPTPVARALELLPQHRAPRHFLAGVTMSSRATTRGVALPSRRALAVAAVATVAAGAVFPLAGVVVLGVTLARPSLVRRRRERGHLAAVEHDVADVVTLLGLAVSAGHNLTGAIRAASARGDGPVANALRATVMRVERGERLADVLEALPALLGESVRPMVAAFVSCDRYGAPLTTTLDRLAADVRVSARQRAEAAARRLPVRLLFPLVSCILPAFALLTVAPLIAGSLNGLAL